ncbi:hypothetical protein EDD37DRAFT_362598 [Exophiala viscosa]|uniref:uncharacterized protein n=1 Tax=Exophiala viscosa TaxID=2486360 RepID=UPI00219857C6|nr:hypothetical protein EDD37DRAFT_362598 [Exophiala viscosa]
MTGYKIVSAHRQIGTTHRRFERRRLAVRGGQQCGLYCVGHGSRLLSCGEFAQHRTQGPCSCPPSGVCRWHPDSGSKGDREPQRIRGTHPKHVHFQHQQYGTAHADFSLHGRVPTIEKSKMHDKEAMVRSTVDGRTKKEMQLRREIRTSDLYGVPRSISLRMPCWHWQMSSEVLPYHHPLRDVFSPRKLVARYMGYRGRDSPEPAKICTTHWRLEEGSV